MDFLLLLPQPRDGGVLEMVPKRGKSENDGGGGGGIFFLNPMVPVPGKKGRECFSHAVPVLKVPVSPCS